MPYREGIHPYTMQFMWVLPIMQLLVCISIMRLLFYCPLLFILQNVPRIYHASNNAVHHATEVAPTDTLTAPIDTEDVPKSTGTTSIGTVAAPNDRHAINIEPITVPSVQMDELREITDNFGTKSLIYVGTNGRLYKGTLKSGRASCIKKFRQNWLSDQFFLTQASLLSRLKHENVIELLGYSVDGNLRVLAYEYASNGSLRDILHGRKGGEPGRFLSWSQRVKIAVGAAKGLEYLHEMLDTLPGNVTSSNVLLFEDDVAKIADTELSNQQRKMHLPSTHAGYCALEWSEFMQIDELDVLGGRPFVRPCVDQTSKSDVYSFGVVLLELLTGCKPIAYTLLDGQQKLVSWVTPKLSEDEVRQHIDPKLKGEFHPKQAAKMAAVAALCVQSEAKYRPTMRIVVKALQPLLNALPGPRREAPHSTSHSKNTLYPSVEEDATISTGKDKQAVNIQPTVVPFVQLDELKLKHDNVVELLSDCVDGGLCILANEYCPSPSSYNANNVLPFADAGREGIKDVHSHPVLPWPHRVKIAVEAVKGLVARGGTTLYHPSWRKLWPGVNLIGVNGSFSLKKGVWWHSSCMGVDCILGNSIEDKVEQCIDPRLNGEYPPKNNCQEIAAIVALCLHYEPDFRPNRRIIVNALQYVL
ncbi:hypothetical protein LguiB_026141 [Lonicera macranthoides]